MLRIFLRLSIFLFAVNFFSAMSSGAESESKTVILESPLKLKKVKRNKYIFKHSGVVPGSPHQSSVSHSYLRQLEKAGISYEIVFGPDDAQYLAANYPQDEATQKAYIKHLKYFVLVEQDAKWVVFTYLQGKLCIKDVTDQCYPDVYQKINEMLQESLFLQDPIQRASELMKLYTMTTARPALWKAI